jgi:pimeloyl-ACP methyl ester carboxylesterase
MAAPKSKPELPMSPRIPLLLLPCLICDAAVWHHQINALKDMADCRVADLSKYDRIEALADEALRLAPPKFALAAISMGGYVAFEIMRRAPERVLRLCLLDTSARADSPEQKARRKLLMAMARSGQFKGVTPRLLPTLIHAQRRDDKDLTAIIMAMAERMGRDVFLRQQAAILNRIDSRPFLKAIHCKTQVIGGLEDELTPPELLREIAHAIPGARLDMIENCGHLSPLERPEEVTNIMRRWVQG